MCFIACFNILGPNSEFKIVILKFWCQDSTYFLEPHYEKNKIGLKNTWSNAERIVISELAGFYVQNGKNYEYTQMSVEYCKPYIVDLTVSLGDISYEAYQKESLKFFRLRGNQPSINYGYSFSYLTQESRLGFSVSTKTLIKLYLVNTTHF